MIENDPSGSMNYVVVRAIVGGVFPMPQEVFKGPDFTPGATAQMKA